MIKMVVKIGMPNPANFRRLRPGLLCFLAVMSAAASAQPAQTADGAQRFMALTSANGSTSIEIPLHDGGYNNVQFSRQDYARECKTDFWTGGRSCKTVPSGRTYYYRQVSPFPMSGASAIDKCRTVFNLSSGYSDVPNRFEVNWAKVTKAEASDNQVTLSGEKVRFTFSSNELATRFAYAATFLQGTCDPTASTGF